MDDIYVDASPIYRLEGVKEGREREREGGSVATFCIILPRLVCLSLSLAQQPNDEKFLFTHERTDGTGERRRNTTLAVVKIRQETERARREMVHFAGGDCLGVRYSDG